MSAYCVLVHHPVRARDGSTVTTAVTNLDVHDIARLARTYDLAGYFVVTPIEAQRALVERILDHWRDGGGKKRIPERSEALERVRVVSSLEEVLASITASEGHPPRVVVTAARSDLGLPTTPYASLGKDMLTAAKPTLLVFGTGHGLTDDVLRGADAVLPPIRGGGGYNHLSVRAAAAITLDRLLGEKSLG